MTEKIKELARKLLELAKRGVGGEKENAQTMLDKLLLRHGITVAELEGEEMRPVAFRYLSNDPHKKNRFLFQVIASVIGSKRVTSTVQFEPSSGESYCYISMTPAEEIEAKAKFDFYWRDFLEQADIFRSAYIQQNELYAKPDGDEDHYKELTDEEKGRLYKEAKMMDAIDKKSYLKQLK